MFALDQHRTHAAVPSIQAKALPFFQPKSNIGNNTTVQRTETKTQPAKPEESKPKKEHVCKHNDPCSKANAGKKYALHWGSDTVCSKFGFPDTSLKVKSGDRNKKHTDESCCNHNTSYVEDYAISLGLDGAASCAYKNQRKIATVGFNSKTVKVICSDTYPSGKNCDQEIELSQKASAALNGGTANNLCPITVNYAIDQPKYDLLCYTEKKKGCISDYCEKNK